MNQGGYPPNYKFPAKYAWMDGAIVPWSEARLHVNSGAVTQAASVFEGIRAYWNREQEELYVFKLAEHLDRLFDSSMKILRLSIPFSRQDLADALVELIKRNEFREDIHLRTTCYFGLGERQSVDPAEVYMGACITAGPLPQSSAIKTGIQCCVSSWERISDHSQPPRIKAAANYLSVRLATIQAKVDGYDDALLLNREGKVSEAPVSCIFMVRNGTVITPPITSNILESITRTTLIHIYREELGIETVERDIDRTELYIAEELFLCGTGREVTPVVSVDRLPVADGQPGPLTRQVQDMYFDIVRGKSEKYLNWLTPVYH